MTSLESSNQPLLLSTRKHRQQFDQEPLTVAQIAGCKGVGISDEKAGPSVSDIENANIHELLSNVDAELLKAAVRDDTDKIRNQKVDGKSLKAVVEENDSALLNTTTFSEPDFSAKAPIAPIAKPKTKSILRDTTNTIRNLKDRTLKGKHHKEQDKKDSMNVKAGGDKKVVLKLKQPRDSFVPIKDRLFKQKTKWSKPVIDNKSEPTPATTTIQVVDDAAGSSKKLGSSKEEQPSFETASFSLDDSDLSTDTPTKGKKQEDNDSLFFVCGLKDMMMFELHCHTPVHDTANYIWNNYVAKVPQHINSMVGGNKGSTSESKSSKESKSALL